MEEFEGEPTTMLPYGIRPRQVYYVCLQCGQITSKDEMDQMPNITCPNCGYRIFIKVRVPPHLGHLRKV